MRRALIVFTCVCSLLFAIHAKSQTLANATIAWNPSPSANVAGYIVYYGTSSGNYVAAVPVSNVTTLTIRGLVSGVKYYFAAAALDSLGNQSPLSPEISGVVGSTSSGGATLTAAVTSPTGQFGFTVSDATGNQYIVQASTDLVNWVSLQTNTAPFNFIDPNSSQYSSRYYRTVLIPND